jgi:predicted NAD/FAD-dependent oxidoreductase
VVVFVWGGGRGGGAAPRRDGAAAFDHGAQYFTARDARFVREVESWRRAGVVAPWIARFGVIDRGKESPAAEGPPRFVGVPDMGAVARHLARGLDVRCGARVVRIEGGAGAWRLGLADGGELGPFERVVVTTPAPQSAALMGEIAPALAARLQAVHVKPCWAVMAEFRAALPTGLDGAFVHDSPLAWIAREASKPERAAGERWTLHATAEWSAEHLGADPTRVGALLLDALSEALAGPLPTVVAATAHLWRFASPDPVAGDRSLVNEELGLAACGDALGGARIEGAWLSGTSLCEALGARS